MAPITAGEAGLAGVVSAEVTVARCRFRECIRQEG